VSCANPEKTQGKRWSASILDSNFGFSQYEKITVRRASVVAMIHVLFYEIWGFAMVYRDVKPCGVLRIYDHFWTKDLNNQGRHAPTDYSLHLSIIIIIIIIIINFNWVIILRCVIPVVLLIQERCVLCCTDRQTQLVFLCGLITE
jgi:hypothetical protein